MDVIVGLQWGDEGKGKIVDALAPNYQVVARFQGGPNAGHTLVVNGQKIILHHIPSGIVHEHTVNLIGAGVVVDPLILQEELEQLTRLEIPFQKRLFVDWRTHLILPTHRLLDQASEMAKGKKSIGSTLKGIGPAYMDRTGRNALRVADVFQPDFLERYRVLRQKHERLLQMWDATHLLSELTQIEPLWLEAVQIFKDVVSPVNGPYWLAQFPSSTILAEGAQGTLLDNLWGTYPYVTSSQTISSAAPAGLGLPPQSAQRVIGVFKAYTTRVGNGPFPTEMSPPEADQLREQGQEYGATTGRPRRCGWLDLVALRYACLINGVTELAMTKADVLAGMPEVRIATAYRINGQWTTEFPPYAEKVEPVYETLPGWQNTDPADPHFAAFLQRIEQTLQRPIRWISYGPERHQLREIQPTIVF